MRAAGEAEARAEAGEAADAAGAATDRREGRREAGEAAARAAPRPPPSPVEALAERPDAAVAWDEGLPEAFRMREEAVLRADLTQLADALRRSTGRWRRSTPP